VLRPRADPSGAARRAAARAPRSAALASASAGAPARGYLRGIRTPPARRPDAATQVPGDPRSSKERTEPMFKTIVWATDGSELADAALDFVRELAREDGSRIVAVHANEVMRGRSSGYPALADEPELEEKIGRQIEELRSVGIDATVLIRTGNKTV